MKGIFSSMFTLVFLFPNPSIDGGEKERDLTSAQKLLLGLGTKEIRGDLPSEKMLDLCIPASKRTLGRFTEYEFEIQPHYWGLTIIAKDGLLKSATEWSCTHTRTYFDEMTQDDEKHYKNLRKEYADVPHERFIGRWGWDRPRKQLPKYATQK